MDDTGELLRIETLNGRGEGVTADGRVVSGGLPGEAFCPPGRVEATSPLRAAPICKYYGVCGGCAAQHLGPELYADWKRGLVVAALERVGVAAEVGALVDAHGEGRRRATFHARFLPNKRDEVGFMRARSHEIIEIDACPLFSPGLAGAIPAARALAGDLRGLEKPLDIQVTATLAGLDVDVRGSGALEGAELRKLAHTAEVYDLARVANHGCGVIERRPPEIAFGSARVVPPAGGFLQATVAGEEAMAALALAALKGSRKIADLFCGAGAFAFRLAPSHEVLAIDSDAPAIAAMTRARASAPEAQRVRAETRDLFHRPLRPEELDAFDAVLFDPPRAGALAQAKELAKSKVPVVVAVSCSAESFSRDARALVDGGYLLESVAPLDQFRFSPHVEIVAVFRRKREPKRRRGVLS
jgi:23S rRNA (uracil1939-C5)-methyltransferase